MTYHDVLVTRSDDVVTITMNRPERAPGGRGGWFCHTPMVAIARNVGRKRAMELALASPSSATSRG